MAEHEASEDVAACLKDDGEACVIAARRLCNMSSSSPIPSLRSREFSLERAHPKYPNSEAHTNLDCGTGLRLLEKACYLDQPDACYIMAKHYRMNWFFDASRKDLGRKILELAMPACRIDHAGACDEAVIGAVRLQSDEIREEAANRACALGIQESYCEGRKILGTKTPIDTKWVREEIAKPKWKPEEGPPKMTGLGPKYMVGAWQGRGSGKRTLRYHFCADGSFALEEVHESTLIRGRYTVDENKRPRELNVLRSDGSVILEAVISRRKNIVAISHGNPGDPRPTDYEARGAFFKSDDAPDCSGPEIPAPDPAESADAEATEALTTPETP